MTVISALLGLSVGFHDQHSIQEVLQPKLHDATFVARVVKGDQAELAKINKDFGQSYRFEYTKVYMKEPFKLRLETKVDDMDVMYIINGVTQMYRVPKARINQKNDLSHSPGRRQTAMDFGILTPSLFEGMFDAKFIRTDRATGAYVFDLTYQANLGDTSRSRIWVQPEKKYIMKREWYNQIGELRAVFSYESPVEAGGVWFPTRFTARNVENHVAGVTQYETVKANTGVSDALFKM